MNRIVGILAASAVFSGCATEQQQIDSHAPALNSWVGAPIEEYLDIHGIPTALSDRRLVVTSRGNHQIYRFEARKTSRYIDWGKSCSQTTYPGEQPNCIDVINHVHTTTFECTYELVVVENFIKDWSMNGNDCQMIAVSHRSG